jgi:two-component system, cell cycle response regulator DivK
MPGEPILIVDDTPVNLKLTRILLVNEGYNVATASSAEEALELLRNYHPSLVLADIQLPGMDGLEFTRRLKQDKTTKDILVVALTAFAMKGDEQKAREAGCDGYITKPIDTRALGKQIREYLDRRKGAVKVDSTADPVDAVQGEWLQGSELNALRQRFLDEGQDRARSLLCAMDGNFHARDAARAVHQWIGTAGLLGYADISQLARDAEALLLERPLDNAQLRDSLFNLVLAFSTVPESQQGPVPEAIQEALGKRKIALVGLPAGEQERLSEALQRAGAVPLFFEHKDRPGSPAAQECSMSVVHVGPAALGSEWLNPQCAEAMNRPAVFAGGRDDLLSLDTDVQSMAHEFLMDAWLSEEALVRLTLAATRRLPGAWRGMQDSGGHHRALVVVADDDPIVVSLVQTVLRNFGMECHTAENGNAGLELIRRLNPQLAVLDVNMPGMDGYEVLAAIRADDRTMRVVLLTARQQESDVIRGFALGADDYIVKPFSPMELVARLKRLMAR